MSAHILQFFVTATMALLAGPLSDAAHLQGSVAETVQRNSGPFMVESMQQETTPSVVDRASGPFMVEGIPAHASAPEDTLIPVLVYHHVRAQEGWAKSTWSWKMTVSPAVFDAHMQWLDDHGYTTITLDTLTSIVNGEQAGPTKPVVVTFDDNNLNVLQDAVPAMVRRGQIGVFYLVANRLDNPAFIGRAHIPDLITKGMDIQSHTLTHAGLTNLNNAQADWELTESKRLLEEATGKPVRHVAYPLTMHNPRIRERAALAGYVTGTIMDPRPMKMNDDKFKIPRIMMTDDTDLTKVLP
jgi:peptidoglycan/xylan/chitin deacetylase (PgdA/CDA1 family)